MRAAGNVAVVVVAVLHLYFLILEMFLWEKPLGLRTFRLTPEFAKASKALAANQGLYILWVQALPGAVALALVASS